MYAIIETGGKQLKVEEGQTIYVEKLDVEEGKNYVFDKVVALENGGLTLGTPYVDGAKVSCKVESRVRERRSLSSSTNRKPVQPDANRVIVSHTPS